MSRKLDLIDEEKCDKVARRATECSSLDKTGNVRTKSHVTLNKMKIRSRFLSKQSFSVAESFRKREREMEELKD